MLYWLLYAAISAIVLALCNEILR